MALRGSLLHLLRAPLKHSHCQRRGWQSVSQGVSIVGAPFSKGQGRAGVERGPKAIRDAGLIERLSALGHRVCDFGDAVRDDEPPTTTTDEPFRKALFPRAVGEANRRVSVAVRDAVGAGYRCVVLGGDHSMSVGSVCGHALRRPSLGVLWVDAHADVNTPETSPSGNLHGQSVAFLLRELREQTSAVVPGFQSVWPCLSARDLVYVGLRDVDPGERRLLERLDVLTFTMRDVDRLGVARVMERALHHLLSGEAYVHRTSIHLSFDIDAFDPSVAPATGTPASGGLSYREGMYVAEEVHRTGLLAVMDLMEVNPALGGGGAGEATAKLAVDVIAAAFGQTRGQLADYGEYAAYPYYPVYT